MHWRPYGHTHTYTHTRLQYISLLFAHSWQETAANKFYTHKLQECWTETIHLQLRASQETVLWWDVAAGNSHSQEILLLDCSNSAAEQNTHALRYVKPTNLRDTTLISVLQNITCREQHVVLISASIRWEDLHRHGYSYNHLVTKEWGCFKKLE